MQALMLLEVSAQELYFECLVRYEINNSLNLPTNLFFIFDEFIFRHASLLFWCPATVAVLGNLVLLVVAGWQF